MVFFELIFNFITSQEDVTASLQTGLTVLAERDELILDIIDVFTDVTVEGTCTCYDDKSICVCFVK